MSAAVKTLTELGDLMGKGTAANEERLLSFLEVYQRDNAGQTPSYAVMANQLGILEEGVRILLARLENKGKVHFISRNPPRIMLIGRDTVLPHEPGAADKGLAKEGAAGRYLDAEGERMRLGRYIASHVKQHGKGPSLGQMVEFVGWAKPSYVGRMAEILAERGLIQYGRGLVTNLTEQGRQFFGVRAAPTMEQAMGQATRAKPVIVMKDRRPPTDRVNALCKALAERIRNGGQAGNFTRYSDLCADLGYSRASTGAITAIAAEAIHRGYIEPKGKKTHGLFFTEKGLRKFMPETAAPPETIPCPEPIVAQVARGIREAEERRAEPRAYEKPYIAAPVRPLQFAETAALIMELVERGYTVRK